MLGLGVQEIIVLAILAIMVFGVPIVVLAVVFAATRRNAGSRIAELEAENQRLRDELEHNSPSN